MTGDDENLSWHERELIGALRRLANARAQVDALETQLASDAADPGPDPADLGRLRAIAAEVQSLEPKARSRFGGGGARQRIAELESEERLLLDRLGVESIGAAEDAAAARQQGVDRDLLDFARRELETATREWEAVQAIEVPDEPAPDDADAAVSTPEDGNGGDAAGAPGLASVSDLTGRLRRPEAS